MELDHTTELTLQALEESMWRAETRFDRKYMEAVLHPDFGEVGRSGRIYTRDETLSLAPMPIDVELPLTDFYAMSLADGVALVRYTSIAPSVAQGAAHRSSIWVRGAQQWLLRYHQATPAAR